MNTTLEDRIVSLKFLSDAQYHQVCVLEDHLFDIRRQHMITMKELNKLYAVRSLERSNHE